MKKYLSVVTTIGLLIFLISCGGGGSSSPDSSKSFVKITLGGSEKPDINSNQGTGFRENSIPSSIYKLSFTISASDMATVNKDVLVAGQSSITETFSIQSGISRYFLIEAKDSSGTILYKGDTTKDLDGTPVTLDIDMVSQGTTGGGTTTTTGTSTTTTTTSTTTTTTTTDTTAPTVSSVSPASSATGVSISTTITATFSEAMDSSTITTSTFTVSGVSGTVSYSGTTATFTPSSNLSYSTSYTATISTGVKDSAGNAMTSSYSWSFTTGAAPDTTAPTVDSVSPASSATGVSISTTITATFSEAMDSSTITTSTFTLSNGGSVTGTVSYSGTTATFTPSSSLSYSTTYTATLTTGVKDSAGNAMASTYTWSWTTRPPPGTLDTTFDTDGKVTTAIGSGNDWLYAIAIQSDGKIVAAGFSDNGSNNDIAVVRYNTDGTLDTTFDTDGKVTTAIGSGNDWLYAIAIQSDGKIVAAGFSDNGSNNDIAVVRYNTDGSLDTTFDTDGKVTTPIGSGNDIIRAIAIQSDGKIVAAGYSHNGSNNDIAVVRYNTDGTLDTTFDTDGKVTTAIGSGEDSAYAVAIQSDGKIVAAGSSYNGSNYDFAFVRYNTDGSLDTTFDTDGKVTTAIGSSHEYVRGVAIQSDGKIVAAGYDATSDFALVRYNSSDGSLDTTFDTDGKVITNISSNDYADAVAIQSDGKIVAAGSALVGSFYDFALVRYNSSNGSLDTSFDTDGKVTTNISGNDYAYAAAIQSDGKIVAAGVAGGANNDFALARYWQ